MSKNKSDSTEFGDMDSFLRNPTPFGQPKKNIKEPDEGFSGIGDFSSYKSRQSSSSNSIVRTIGANSGTKMYGNQYAQVGELVDMWSNVFDGLSSKSEQFWTEYNKAKSTRRIPVDSTIRSLEATGINAPTRIMDFNRLSPVTVTVYMAHNGNDLYVSWRAFVKAPVSLFKVAFVLLLVVLLSLLTSGAQIFPFNSTNIDFYRVNINQFLANMGLFSVVIFYLVFSYAFFNRRGDIWGYLRQPIHELHYDELSAVSMAIHGSIIQAADALGVEAADIQPHEPYFERRRRPRI